MIQTINLSASRTPLQHNADLSEFLGVPFYIKREDMCGASIGANCSDARKLEFLLVELSKQCITDLVIIGRYSSHYTLALAKLATTYGIKVHCVFFDEFQHEHTTALSVLQMIGAETHGTRDVGYTNTLIESLQVPGKNVYVSKAGGSHSVAAMGGYALYDEINLDLLVSYNVRRAEIYVGSDSGTSLGGMLVAESDIGDDTDNELSIIGVPLFNECGSQRVLAQQNAEYLLMSKSDQTRSVEPGSINMCDNPLLSNAGAHESILSMRWFFKQSGIALDPIYGAPVLAAIIKQVHLRDSDDATPVVFVNPSQASTPYFTYNTPSLPAA